MIRRSFLKSLSAIGATFVASKSVAANQTLSSNSDELTTYEVNQSKVGLNFSQETKNSITLLNQDYLKSGKLLSIRQEKCTPISPSHSDIKSFFTFNRPEDKENYLKEKSQILQAATQVTKKT